MAENSTSSGAPVSKDTEADVGLIEGMLRSRLGHRIRDLRIWIEPHGMIITGCTTSYYDKQMAQHMVREMSGLGVADNRIVVNSADRPDEFQSCWSYRDIVAGRHRPGQRNHVGR